MIMQLFIEARYVKVLKNKNILLQASKSKAMYGYCAILLPQMKNPTTDSVAILFLVTLVYYFFILLYFSCLTISFAI